MNLGKRDENEQDPLAVKDLSGNDGKGTSWRKVHSAAQQSVGRASSLGSNKGRGQYPNFTNRRVLTFAILGRVLVIAIVGYLLLSQSIPTVVQAPVNQAPVKQATPPSAISQPVPQPDK